MVRPCIVLTIAFCLTSGIAARAQSDYPQKAIRIVVPATPGGGADTFARLIAEDLSRKLNQNVIVENRPGGGMLIAMDVVAKAPPDGYTLYLATSGLTAMHVVRKVMPYDVQQAFTPITQIAVIPQALVVDPKLPVKDVSDFVQLSKRNPGTMTFGSAGVGTGHHMAMELFKQRTGADVRHIPYRGVAQSVTDILGGRLGSMMLNVVIAKPHVDAGGLRAIGVTSLKPAGPLPEVRPIAEQGVSGFVALQWFGVLAPAHTPVFIRNKLQQAIAEGLQTAQMKTQLKSEGADAVGSTPLEFATLIQNEIKEWTNLAKSVDLSSEQ
jgi:tripartite-type tricarboxylate transporter receptor subunit TctC